MNGSGHRSTLEEASLDLAFAGRGRGERHTRLDRKQAGPGHQIAGEWPAGKGDSDLQAV